MTFFPWLTPFRADQESLSDNIFHCVSVSLRCVAERLHLLDRHRDHGGRGLETKNSRRMNMATIGVFKKAGSDLVGDITTLNVQTKNVRIVPEENRANDIAPTHRVFSGKAEIGAAWSKRSSDNRDYLSIKLDDPSFVSPVYANLFANENGVDYSLIWSRNRKATVE
jgi:uncharacterized protein (DUF736 family)